MMRRTLPALLLGTLALPALAAGPVRQEPVQLRAERIEIDQKTGLSRYLGRVVFTQGTLRLTADRAEARHRGDVLEQVTAHGRPLTFRERPAGRVELVEGSAARAEYEAVARRLHLYGDVELRHGRDELRAGVLHYDLANETVLAESDGGRRVYAALAARKAVAPPGDKP
jgi:lipopolysaccharide export system protein LptA